MGVICAPDIFQENMFTLIKGLEYVRNYLDNLLVLSLGSFEEHLQDIEWVLLHLKNVGLKLNIKNLILEEQKLVT